MDLSRRKFIHSNPSTSLSLAKLSMIAPSRDDMTRLAIEKTTCKFSIMNCLMNLHKD